MPSFLGLSYPITKNSQGYFGTITDNNTIKSDLLILLLTSKRERVMLPSFGTSLTSLLFQPNDPTLEAQATALITAAITQWEPRVSISQLTVTSSVTRDLASGAPVNPEDEHVLTITISFSRFDNLQAVDQLVLQLPLGG